MTEQDGEKTVLGGGTKLNVTLAVLLIGAAIANVTAIQVIPERVLEKADERYVRKDVNDQALRSLEFKIDELRRAVERGK